MRKIGVGLLVGMAFAAFTTPAHATDMPSPSMFKSKVTVNVAGAGKVFSGGGATCDQTANQSKAVAVCQPMDISGLWSPLDAVPAPGWTFDGWTGCNGTAGNFCYLVAVGDRTVTARFVDKVAPEIFITLPAPSGSTFAPTLTTSDPTARITSCSVDGVVASDCRWTLKDGPHLMSVVAQDPSGNVATKTKQFSIDGTPPAIALQSGPADRVNTTTAAFAFTVSDGKIECSLDKAAFVPCSSPYTVSNLAEGTHVLRIKATDAVGNVATLDRLWTVDTESPLITLTGGDGGDFVLAVDKPATITCALDGAPFTRCDPGHPVYPSAGQHTLTVRADDGVDPVSTVTRTFFNGPVTASQNPTAGGGN
jgi:hypothetical protein